jgi:hypothetical protein
VREWRWRWRRRIPRASGPFDKLRTRGGHHREGCGNATSLLFFVAAFSLSARCRDRVADLKVCSYVLLAALHRPAFDRRCCAKPESASLWVWLRDERDDALITQLRLYTVNRGMMDSWLAAFEEHIMPTSAKFGIKINVAFVNRPQNCGRTRVRRPWRNMSRRRNGRRTAGSRGRTSRRPRCGKWMWRSGRLGSRTRVHCRDGAESSCRV